MLGASIADLRAEGVLRDGTAPHGARAHLGEGGGSPFHRFRTPDGRGVDSVLGPEMKSTGEVMGLDTTFDLAFARRT